MSKRPRSGRLTEHSPVVWNITVPWEVASRVERALSYPGTNEIPYGARTNLVATLLTEWLNKREAPRVDTCDTV